MLQLRSQPLLAVAAHHTSNAAAAANRRLAEYFSHGPMQAVDKLLTNDIAAMQQ